ncbi:Zinc finger CCCH domain-containing protein 22 [Camellia lanceoleosa]|uniref:Zinc finger CCCH domain-containing protein 22 n=1 Tax=Camellia lanceoleosa TaxID=1840588 RepID=A0ACC0G9N8_9ERIC|nr:Zinc finger CCCH domain-containing protein 22 [Camellia lanceoleosa]
MKHGERGFIDCSTICLQWFLYCSLGENGSNPTMAVAATAAGDQQLEQTANVSEKEKEKETSIASNDIGNGSGKESPHLHEESDLPERSKLWAIVRSKSAQQQRLAAASQLMASTSPPYSAVAANKCMNLPLQQQQSDTQRATAALMMGEDMHKFGQSRLDRNEFLMNGGLEMVNPGSRQIYLTFPADSTFRDKDVSNYSSIYGPVQDVRIPYQQKRMFGFVTFVYPETVKLILAKGNPHFVCDAWVLVKPYKEKGKVPDKYRKLQHQQQQMER